jgi:hypothetical protein
VVSKPGETKVNPVKLQHGSAWGFVDQDFDIPFHVRIAKVRIHVQVFVSPFFTVMLLQYGKPIILAPVIITDIGVGSRRTTVP